MIRGEMVRLTPIVVGTAALLATGGLSVAIAGPIRAVPVLLVTGIFGGAVSGWLGNTATKLSTALQHGGFLGLHASGLGGLIVFIAFLFVDTATVPQRGDVFLLFVASPLAPVVFALEGLLGGYLGSGLRLLFRFLTAGE